MRTTLLPEKVAAAYTGWICPAQTTDLEALVVRPLLDPLAAAGFTAFYGKVQVPGRGFLKLSEPRRFARLRQVAEACRERDLAFVAYTYTQPHKGLRDPDEDAAYPALLTSSGQVVEDHFALAHWETLRLMTDAMFQLAEASRELPIAAVGVDVEHLRGTPVSYDDPTWADYTAERPELRGLPAAERADTLAAQELADDYRDWYAARWDGLVNRLADELHAINPRLSLAIMPITLDSWFIRPFVKHFGTRQAPALIDHWGMYNGSGLTPELLALQDEVRALNPHNRYILWFRPDSYRSEDITAHAYHTLMRTDGYCNWHVNMIVRPETEYARWRYLRAYGRANMVALADLANGRGPESYPWEPVEPRVGMLDVPALRSRPIPQLTPVGEAQSEGPWVPSRDLQRFLVYGRAGERLRLELRHLAGDRRPLALQYALIGPGGNVVRNEAVMPGESTSFAVQMPATGTAALYVTGGTGGQAWYAVRVPDAPLAFPCTPEEPGRFFWIDEFAPLDAYLTRTDPEAAAEITVTAGKRQAIRVQVADGAPVLVAGPEPQSLPVPPGPGPIRIRLERPAELPDESYYVQHVRLIATGAVHPYLSFAPESRLLPRE